jgi:hypothetical protein
LGDLRSLRRADARFVLPALPRRAVVLGGLADWCEGLEAAGVSVVPAGAVADLVVAPAVLARDAASLGVGTVLVDGAVRSLPGMASRRILTLPRTNAPQYVVDPAQRAAAAYAGSLLPRFSRVAPAVLGAGVRMPLAAVTVGARVPGRPAVLAAAAAFGAERGGEWFLALGSGGVRRRAVFYVFAPGSRAPSQVVKFGRVAGEYGAFDRDERGLALALSAGAVVADKAPRLVGRGDACGLPASVETALPGAGLAPSVAAAEPVVTWLRAVARATVSRGQDGEPRVFRHGDVFPGNVVVTGEGFRLVDWEHAEPAGLPLADLLFLAAHVVDGDPVEAFATGSPVLARWLREAAGDLGLTGDQVVDIAWRTWEAHGGRARAARVLRESLTAQTVPPYPAERVADAWTSDGRLGRHWRPW